MHTIPAVGAGLCACVLAACAAGPAGEPGTLAGEVRATEAAFARTMAERDHRAFTAFLSDEAVFFAGSRALRGKDAIAAAWKPFYETPTPPFSWAPGTVEVLDSGQLALSSGPVHDASGRRIATFTSIWRREAPGVWRIIFDKGCQDGAP
ncbi:MAG TPA: nuclear transport factor 2 family protein [Ideonella sp.]|nr:nuclear transport factor 2 family protein [Ideonella sp.]